MTTDEKYQLALQALRYYASKEGETLCELNDFDPYSYATSGEGAEEVAVAALTVLDEPVKGEELVVPELLDWKFKAGLLTSAEAND